VPVFAGEWGGRADDLDWGVRLASYFEDRGMGWTAWSWSDEPRLIEYPPQPPYDPTVFGALIRDLLRRRPVLEGR
jgi:endoglucanase